MNSYEEQISEEPLIDSSWFDSKLTESNLDEFLSENNQPNFDSFEE